MKRLMAAISIAAGLLAAGGAQADPAYRVGVGAQLSREAVWAATPSAAVAAGVYPAEGRQTFVYQMRCDVGGHGELLRCEVLKGGGGGATYWEAARRLIAHYRLDLAATGVIAGPDLKAIFFLTLAPAAADTPEPDRRVWVSAPVAWVDAPTEADLARFPALPAWRDSVVGARCRVGQDGALEDCKPTNATIESTPEHLAWGVAVVSGRRVKTTASGADLRGREVVAMVSYFPVIPQID